MRKDKENLKNQNLNKCFGKITPRTELKVLPSDTNNYSIVWTVTEVVGTGVCNVRGIRKLFVEAKSWQESTEDVLNGKEE